MGILTSGPSILQQAIRATKPATSRLTTYVIRLNAYPRHHQTNSVDVAGQDIMPARSIRPSCISAVVSQPKLEKVVNPPRTPTSVKTQWGSESSYIAIAHRYYDPHFTSHEARHPPPKQ